MKNILHPLVRALVVLQAMRERARARRELAELNERDLRDIGLTRADAIAESSAPFWR